MEGRWGSLFFLRMKERMEEKKLFSSLFCYPPEEGGKGVTGMNLGNKRNFRIVWFSPAFHCTDCLRSLTRSLSKCSSIPEQKKGADPKKEQRLGEVEPSAWFLILVLTHFFVGCFKRLTKDAVSLLAALETFTLCLGPVEFLNEQHFFLLFLIICSKLPFLEC